MIQYINRLLFLAFFIAGLNSSAQDYYRMRADFTIKIKRAEGQSNLTKGTIYYDKYAKELIYDISFPSKEKWVVQDSRIYKIKSGETYFTEEIPSVNEFTVFHLALNSSLEYFGLKEANFAVDKVEKKGDLVISYWKIPMQIQKMISNIALAKKGNQLHSVVIMGKNNQIINRQFFKDYIKIDGFEFPGTIVQIFYEENQQENYQVMEFENIVLNDTENDSEYHYELER
ncbi:hypothetical protein [Maribellus maritimus]|uniref:hypothetical protein n=1 Tax=Maribellus maritimus TaxID=2870838 RepID=UPI001EE9C687|nr:hypothetical protein [Maribellus maritimus]MCG6187509.1 hypothetical protein [Maribellus maritimus]